MHYFGLYANDSWRVSRKLTLQLGVRWESPGSFEERHNSLTTWDPTLPQTALASATGLPIQGGLVLDGSQQRPNRSWQDPHYHLFSPRIGVAYSPDESTVFRAGYGIEYLPIHRVQPWPLQLAGEQFRNYDGDRRSTAGSRLTWRPP